jgi:hypothetical protein
MQVLCFYSDQKVILRYKVSVKLKILPKTLFFGNYLCSVFLLALSVRFMTFLGVETLSPLHISF